MNAMKSKFGLAASGTLISLSVGLWVLRLSAGAAQVPVEVTSSGLLTELTRLETASWEAWQKRDGTFFATFLSDDHVEVGAGGPVGKKAVLAGVSSPNCVVKHYELDHFAVTIFNTDTAVLTYHAQQDTTCQGNAVPSPVWTSSLYLQRGGRWQNAVYQQTRAAK